MNHLNNAESKNVERQSAENKNVGWWVRQIEDLTHPPTRLTLKSTHSSSHTLTHTFL